MKLAALAVRNTGNLFRNYFEPSRVIMKGGRVMTIHDPGPIKLAAHGLELNLQKAEPFKPPAQDLTGVVDLKPRLSATSCSRRFLRVEVYPIAH